MPGNWKKVVEELSALKELLSTWKRFPDRDLRSLFRDLNKLTDRELLKLFPHTKGHETVAWLFANQIGPSTPEFNTLDVLPLVESIRAGATGSFSKQVKPFRAAVQAYESAWNQILKQAAPESFNYEGFRVLNPFRLTHRTCERLLSGVERVIQIFRRRGLEDLLHQGLKTIEVDEGVRGLKNFNTSGAFDASLQRIHLSTALLSVQKGRFIESWPFEVFLHEFGHYVHLTLLHPEGREVWDGAWSPFRDEIAIQPRVRDFLLEELKASDWNLRKALQGLRPEHRDILVTMLRNPSVGDSLLAEDSLRLSPRGDAYFKRMRDPKFSENEKEDSLGLVFLKQKPKPLLVPHPRSNTTPVQDALGIPSDYGATNEKEDFAETFVLFMTEPQRLSGTALFRMKQALAVSDLYGKQIMRVSAILQRIAKSPVQVDAWARHPSS